MSDDRKCALCKMSEDEETLFKCPMCHKMFCEDCAFLTGGRSFCSRTCSNYFFFGSEDDQ